MSKNGCFYLKETVEITHIHFKENVTIFKEYINEKV